jgi:hypothetical protein
MITLQFIIFFLMLRKLMNLSKKGSKQKYCKINII